MDIVRHLVVRHLTTCSVHKPAIKKKKNTFRSAVPPPIMNMAVCILCKIQTANHLLCLAPKLKPPRLQLRGKCVSEADVGVTAGTPIPKRGKCLVE